MKTVIDHPPSPITGLLYVCITYMDKKELTSKKKALQNKLYLVMVEIIFIFGVPALVAKFLGQYIDGRSETGKLWTLIFLAIAFVVSWVVLVRRVRVIGNEIKEVENELREKKSDEQLLTPRSRE